VSGSSRAPGLGAPRNLARVALAWVVDHHLVLAVGFLAAVPVLVSTVRAIRAGWAPVWDDAIIATNAFDAVSADPRLVGVYSDASVSSVGPIYNAGPVLLWPLGLPAHLLGNWALPATVGAINAVSVVAVVALARRRGGHILMFATAIAVPVMCRSLPAEALHDLFNPSFALMPLTLLVFLAWSVACGDHGLLPVTVLVASFVIQAHASVALAGVAVLLVALVGFATSRTRRRGEPEAMGGSRRPWIVAALAVALVCWAAPVVDMALHPPGNLVRIARTASIDEATAGMDAGWHSLVRAIGVRPWWLRSPPSQASRVFDVFGAPRAPQTVSAALVLGLLLLVAATAWRRRRADLAAGAALALALAGAIAVTIGQTPQRLALNIDKAVRWTSPAGMFVWLVAGWSGVAVARATAAVRSPRLGHAALWSSRAATLAGLGTTALVGVLVASDQERDSWQRIYQPVNTLTSALDGQVPRHRTLLVANGAQDSGTGFAIQTALVYHLRRTGHDVVTSNLAQKLGPRYSIRHHPPDEVLTINDQRTRVSTGAQILARTTVVSAPGSRPAVRPLTVTLTPASASARRQGG
jgi:hypothetical protein